MPCHPPRVARHTRLRGAFASQQRRARVGVAFALPVGSPHSGVMFTIEDIDIHAEMAVLAALSPELLDPDSHPIPEADARLHPNDYFVVGA